MFFRFRRPRHPRCHPGDCGSLLLSGGRYQDSTEVMGGETHIWSVAGWANVEASAGLWVSERTRVRVFGGAGYLLNSSPSCCRADSGDPCSGSADGTRTLPFFGVAIARTH